MMISIKTWYGVLFWNHQTRPYTHIGFTLFEEIPLHWTYKRKRRVWLAYQSNQTFKGYFQREAYFKNPQRLWIKSRQPLRLHIKITGIATLVEKQVICSSCRLWVTAIQTRALNLPHSTFILSVETASISTTQKAILGNT